MSCCSLCHSYMKGCWAVFVICDLCKELTVLLVTLEYLFAWIELLLWILVLEISFGQRDFAVGVKEILQSEFTLHWTQAKNEGCKTMCKKSQERSIRTSCCAETASCSPVSLTSSRVKATTTRSRKSWRPIWRSWMISWPSLMDHSLVARMWMPWTCKLLQS